jgi:putative phosphoribosyl transferase
MFVDLIWDMLSHKMRIKFKSRESAAKILCEALKDRVNYKRGDTTILGVVRGGVSVAYIVAAKLSCDFDILVPRKLCIPSSDEESMGAVMGDGTCYLNNEIIDKLRIPREYIEDEKFRQIGEIRRRTSLYRPGNRQYNIQDKNIILIDDGAATGATLIVAARWLRKGPNKPSSLTIGIPVAPRKTVDLLKKESDGVEVITSPPDSRFKFIEEHYQRFEAVSDRYIIDIMQKYSSGSRV